MTRYRSVLAVLAPLIILGGIATVVLIRKDRDRELLDLIVHGGAFGTVTYNCSRHSASVDYDARTAGPTEVKLIADRSSGRPAVWSVQTSGSPPVRATGFTANTGSLGGAQGFRWQGSDGRQRTAIASFSDIVGEYGPETIWLSSNGYEFTCGPDPASFRPR